MTSGRVCVIGGGTMAAAYTEALAAAGIQLCGPDDRLQGCDILSAGFDGRATLATLRSLDLEGVCNIVDLATQSISDARSTGAFCEEEGIAYFAGGVTGGASQVGTAEFTMILAPTNPGMQPPDWLELLGRLTLQPSLAAAVSAKLLHNLVLIVSNQILGAALQLAETAEISDFMAILAFGTAGRPIRHTSTCRDRHCGFTSSYTSALVAKDLRAMMESLPELRDVCGLDLAALAAAHDEWGNESFTHFANSQFSHPGAI